LTGRFRLVSPGVQYTRSLAGHVVPVSSFDRISRRLRCRHLPSKSPLPSPSPLSAAISLRPVVPRSLGASRLGHTAIAAYAPVVPRSLSAAAFSSNRPVSSLSLSISLTLVRRMTPPPLFFLDLGHEGGKKGRQNRRLGESGFTVIHLYSGLVPLHGEQPHLSPSMVLSWLLVRSGSLEVRFGDSSSTVSLFVYLEGKFRALGSFFWAVSPRIHMFAVLAERSL
jgi:hypothetical protein